MARRRTIEILEPTLQKDFVQIPNSVLRNPNISMPAKTIYAMLISYAWYNAYCFPGQGTMATDLGVTRQTVKKYLDELKKAGLVNWEKPFPNKPCVYQILEIPLNYRKKEGMLTGVNKVCKSTLTGYVNARLHEVYKEETNKGEANKNDGVFETRTSSTNNSSSLAYEFKQLNKKMFSQEANDILEYYLSCYEENTGSTHPKLKIEQWQHIIPTIEWFMKTYDTDTQNMFDIIDQHFMVDYGKISGHGGTNYNLNHFANEGILQNRFYEVCF